MNKLLYIAFLLLSLTVRAQNEFVNLEVTPELVEVNDYVTIKLTTNVIGDITSDDMNSAFVGVNSGTEMSHEQDKNGKIISVISYTVQGYFTKSGEYTIGPFYITTGQRSFASGVKKVSVVEEVKMYGNDITSTQLKSPAFGMILSNKREIYEGEPLIVSSKIYCRYGAKIVGGETYVVQGALDHYALGDPDVYSRDQEVINGIPFVTFSFDKQLLFPVGDSKVKIEPFKSQLQTTQGLLNLVSSPYSIEIKPLPDNAPECFIGAVGKFKLNVSAPETNQKQGEVFTMTLEVEGTGNLHMTNPPKLNLPDGMEFYADPEIEQQYRFSPMGSHGKIIYTYNILPKNHGDINLDSIVIAYFNPKKGRYEISGIEGPKLKIIQNKNYRPHIKDSSDTKGVIAQLPNIRSEANYFEDGSFFGTNTFWLLTGSPIFLSFLFFFMGIIKRRKAEENKEQTYLNERKLRLKRALEQVEKEKNNINSITFFEAIESAIRNHFEIVILGNSPDRVLLKSEITDFLIQRELIDEARIFEEILSISETARYAPMMISEDRNQIASKLKLLVKS